MKRFILFLSLSGILLTGINADALAIGRKFKIKNKHNKKEVKLGHFKYKKEK
jgi:hypothetical protein